MNTPIPHQILHEAVCISDSTNTLGERHESNYLEEHSLPYYLPKIVGQARLFNLGMATDLGEGKH